MAKCQWRRSHCPHDRWQGALVRDVLPAVVADRVKSPYPSTQDPRYGEAVREELRRLPADSDAPARPCSTSPPSAPQGTAVIRECSATR